MKKQSIWAQNKTVLPTLAVVYGITLILLAIVAWISVASGIKIGVFTRDVFVVLKGPAYSGIISNIGILLWCSAAAINFFTFITIKKQKHFHDWKYFFLFSGLIITWLLLDDFFLFHENSKKIHPFFNGKVVKVYFFVVLFYLTVFRKKILESECIVLVLAFTFFSLSIILDRLEGRIAQGPMHYLFEDGFKLLGIVTMLIYYVRVCSDKLVRSS